MTASDADPPKVGDIVFDQPWQESALKAVITKVDDEGFWTELRFQAGEATVWTSPAVEHNLLPFAFGAWFDGVGLPEWFGDVDNDDSPELLAPIPKADIAPTVFRVFRWNGTELALLGISTLIQQEPGQFRWAAPTEFEGDLTWVDGFENGNARISSYQDEQLNTSHAELVPVKSGFDTKQES